MIPGLATYSSILPGNFHGQRSLVGYSPWGRKESGTTEQLTLTYLNDGRGNEDNGDLLQKVPCRPCYTQCPQPCSRPPLTHASARDSLTLTVKSGSVSCGSLLLSPGSWYAQGSVCALQESVSPVLCKFWWLYDGVYGDILQEDVTYPGLLHRECISYFLLYSKLPKA